jgi:hypothetical protein
MPQLKRRQAYFDAFNAKVPVQPCVEPKGTKISEAVFQWLAE